MMLQGFCYVTDNRFATRSSPLGRCNAADLARSMSVHPSNDMLLVAEAVTLGYGAAPVLRYVDL